MCVYAQVSLLCAAPSAALERALRLALSAHQCPAAAALCWCGAQTQVFPKQLLLSRLPPEVDILCTHPMFGPDSGKASWQVRELVACHAREQDSKGSGSKECVLLGSL